MRLNNSQSLQHIKSGKIQFGVQASGNVQVLQIGELIEVDINLVKAVYHSQISQR